MKKPMAALDVIVVRLRIIGEKTNDSPRRDCVEVENHW
jgi:hypothetical protein